MISSSISEIFNSMICSSFSMPDPQRVSGLVDSKPSQAADQADTGDLARDLAIIVEWGFVDSHKVQLYRALRNSSRGQADGKNLPSKKDTICSDWQEYALRHGVEDLEYGFLRKSPSF